jgi:hypothetical protein
MSEIRLDADGLASATDGWLASAPIEPSIHPICTPGPDPMSVALSAAVAEWPAVHEALTTERAVKAGDLAAATSGTAAIISTADAINAKQITEVESCD